jgi:hypothetical protein
LLFFLLSCALKWNGETRYTLIAPHLISFVRNTKLSLIFVRTEQKSAAAMQLFWGGKRRSWVANYLATFRESLLVPSSHPSRQTDMLPRNVCNYEPTLRNIAEERRPQLQSNKSLEPRILTKLLHGDSGPLRREAVKLVRQVPTFRRNRSACIYMSLSNFTVFNNATNCVFAINVTGKCVCRSSLEICKD